MLDNIANSLFGAAFGFFGAGVSPVVCTFGSDGFALSAEVGAMGAGVSCAWMRSNARAAQMRKAKKNRDMV